MQHFIKSTDRAAHVNVSRNAIFSSRSTSRPEKSSSFDVEIVVKNKSKCGLAWSVLLSTTSTRHYSFPKHFFLTVSACRRVQKFLKGKSDAYK